MKNNRIFSDLREFYILEKDLKEVFEFIEPDGDITTSNENGTVDNVNLNVYSHRLFGLFLRNCTAVEFQLKKILKNEIAKGNLQAPMNGELKKVIKKWKMPDYLSIKSSKELDKYSVKIPSWRSTDNKINPFETWSANSPIAWYEDYNIVKHNLQSEFKRANLKNVRDSLAGLFVLLYVQYGNKVFDPYQEHIGPTHYMQDDKGKAYVFATGSLFAIKKLE